MRRLFSCARTQVTGTVDTPTNRQSNETTMNERLEMLAAELEASGNYKVQRRLQPRMSLSRDDGSPIRRGLMLDLETTGLDPATDEVIEVAALPFTFTVDGHIIDVLPPLDGLRDPSKPIRARITALTGITNDMVAGRTIDPDQIAEIAGPTDLVIAHNAKFDRPFAERLHPIFRAKPWACSMTQTLWTEHGFEGLKLKYLLTSAGLFHDGHRALDDCHAALELLSRPLGDTGRTALAYVLDAAARTTTRIWAVGAPYDKKDLLRSRQYRWNAGDDGRPRAWYLDVGDSERGDEIAVLRKDIFGPAWQPLLTAVTAIDRFSNRI